MDEVVDVISMHLQKRRASRAGAYEEPLQQSKHIVTLNPEIAWTAYKNDPTLHSAITAADLIVPDGIGIVLAARLRGKRIPQRVTGFDLMQRLLHLAARDSYSVFLLGAAPGVAEQAAKAAVRSNPGLKIAGFADGYFKPEEEDALLQRIASLKVDMLFCALGAPRPAEPWIYKNRQNLGVGWAMGVGGSFNIMAGHIKRAPVWMQKMGLEWLHRVIREPRRLKRIAVIPGFMLSALLYKDK